MTQGKLTIQIDEKITDEGFMEHCLNLASSGYDPTILIAFYGLGKSWHISNIKFLQKEINDALSHGNERENKK